MRDNRTNLFIFIISILIFLPCLVFSNVSPELLTLSKAFLATDNSSQLKKLSKKIDAYSDDPQAVIDALQSQNKAAVKPGVYTYQKFKSEEFARKYKDDHLFYYIPELKDGEKPAGLLIYMHGGHKPTPPSVAEAKIKKIVRQENALHRAMVESGMIIVVPTAPQADTNLRWAVPDVDNYLNAIILDFQSQYTIDPDRVFLMGRSMGGDGAYHNVLIAPDRYAAVLGVAGCCYLSYWPVISGTPFWMVHGEFDANPETRPYRWTDVSFARNSHTLLNRYGLDNEYREYPGPHSGGWEEQAQFISRMKKVNRDPFYPKVTLVTRIGNRKSQLVDVTHNRWLTALEVDPDGELLFDIQKKSGVTEPVTDADWKNWNVANEKEFLNGAIIEAENMGDNRINIRTNNIVKFEVWLHPEMVDFSRPVRLFVNDKLVHDKKVTGSISTALYSFKRKHDWGLIYTARITLDKKMWELKPSSDFAAVDEKAIEYRTGEIDPYITAMPDSINRSFFKNPTEESLEEMVQYLIKGTKDPYHKVKRIHDWITDNIAYNQDGFIGTGERISRKKIFEWVKVRKTTCGGFARLFKKMALMAGVETRYIPAWVKSYVTSTGRAGDHVWCAVKIAGRWYIIDCSADSRFKFHHGEFSEKGEYEDHGLFSKPELKLIRGIPKDEENQLVDNPISYEKYMSSPRFLSPMLEYGVKFLTPIQKMITVERKDNESGNHQQLFDQFALKDKSLKIALTCPENILITAELRDSNNKKHTFYSAAHEDGTKVVAAFSPPTPGLYEARIRGKYKDESGYSKTIYKFYIKSEVNGEMISTHGSGFYKLPKYSEHKLKISESDLDGDKGYYMIDVAFPEKSSVVSHMRNDKIKTISKAVITSYGYGHKRFYYEKQKLDTYYIYLFAKTKSATESKHQKAAVVKLQQQKGEKSVFPPVNCFIFKSKFVENSFKALDVDVTQPAEDGGYTLKVQAPHDFKMYAIVRDSDNKTRKGACIYSLIDEKKNIYRFHFTAPDSNLYQGRMYMTYMEGKKEKVKLIGYFYYAGKTN